MSLESFFAKFPHLGTGSDLVSGKFALGDQGYLGYVLTTGISSKVTSMFEGSFVCSDFLSGYSLCHIS